MKPRRAAGLIVVVGLLVLAGPARAQPAQSNTLVVTDKLPESIPIFPLEEPVLFPSAFRPLTIFEPRYRAMVADALKGDRLIGMVTLRPGFEADYEGRPPVYPIGCAGVIESAQELPDGRYAIVLRGLVKFRVVSEDPSRVYRLATVEAMPEALSEERKASLRQERQRLEAWLSSIAPGAPPPPATVRDDEVVSTVAQYLDLDPLARQDLLEREDSLARIRALFDLLPAK